MAPTADMGVQDAALTALEASAAAAVVTVAKPSAFGSRFSCNGRSEGFCGSGRNTDGNRSLPENCIRSTVIVIAYAAMAAPSAGCLCFIVSYGRC